MRIRFAATLLPLTMLGCFQGGDDTSDDEIGAPSTETGDDDNTDTSDSGTTTTSTTESTESETGEDPFVFADDLPEAYTRVDRMGNPIVATALIASKDEFNAADLDDPFGAEVLEALGSLHMVLDDDLVGLGANPCPTLSCAMELGALIYPDTLDIDLAEPPGFPNGRTPEDPAADMMLALMLLDLDDPNQNLGTFATIPLNPIANDLPFPADFPYLAPPH
ncbi:MAG: DUF4331 domain-containing protein [Deltaproteobacteria bacterium]|nr:DUF4331 domain-containing protein [Deltaproteobacteria bacterium]